MGAPTEGLRSLEGLSMRGEETPTAAMLCGEVDEESKEDMNGEEGVYIKSAWGKREG